MTLARMLETAVAREPEAIAIVEGSRRVTYREWRSEVLVLAGGLRDLGLGPDDHLVAVLSNRYETATLYWACQTLGVIFTPFNWRATAEDIAYVLRDAEAEAVFYEERSRNSVLPAIAECELPASKVIRLDDDEVGVAYGEFTAGSKPFTGEPAGDDQATSLMLYTSGTTGRPKGVPRSHAVEQAATLSCLAHLHYGYGEVSLGVMPLFHTMGIRSLLMSVFQNGNFVCMPSFSTGQAFRAIERERISALFLVPIMFHDMVHDKEIDASDMRSVRNIAYAGMAMTSALVEACVEKLAPERFTNFYGSSEIYTFSVCPHVAEKPGCAGRPGMGQMLRVVRADPDERVSPDDVVAVGKTGEIIASMGALDAFDGYWKQPNADEKALREGWYFTGDLGQFDKDGEIYVLGRVDDMIISGGENIYPEEVEDVLAKSPLVGGVAVIGLPDERWGQRVVAFIQANSADVAVDTLDQHCLDSGLARFKRPRAYVFVKDIPRSASGKLLRRHLRSGDYEALANPEST